ncbi:tRNA-splicing endonuclease subunit Sen34 isoform X2 [Frankliniella occidentalis]|uniref:tRNA-splicing endonuclease subunit Sen34 n=1 Tax=Frankliniella occidentalis TaxID=133901 RepID=A0A9C6U5J8_FRAOC|nr:tRNA-splicing endonuclease subunit Sen34 isoform X2 [Frankliniella occidentalis]
MITVQISKDGKPLIWSAEVFLYVFVEWIRLREEYRIVGGLIGVLPNLPNQEVLNGLPMSLLPEETTLLLEKNIICLKTFPSLSRCPGEGVVKAFKHHCRSVQVEQADQMKEERKSALLGLVDKIVEGRRRKRLGLDTKKKRKKGKSAENTDNDAEEKEKIVELLKPIEEIERKTVLDEELAKIPPLSRENTLVQTFTTYPWLSPEDACPVNWTFPSNEEERTRYLTFKDLWTKGFYITTGHKFGGDFLVYPGDPVKFHSHFIVVCVSYTNSMSVHQLISYGRLGSSVRKTVVLASLPQDSSEVKFQSIKWAGSSAVPFS